MMKSIFYITLSSVCKFLPNYFFIINIIWLYGFYVQFKSGVTLFSPPKLSHAM